MTKSMTNYNPGDVLLLPFPFSDVSNTKRRPALVLAVAEKWGELICTMLTSSPQYYNEVVISMWKEAGLLKPTVARVHRLFTIDAQLVIKTLGTLQTNDFEKIRLETIKLLQNGRA
jgi:mRNA interferase MazF